MEPIENVYGMENIDFSDYNEVNYFDDVVNIQRHMYRWLKYDQYYLHFIKKGHLCETEAQQGQFDTLWSISFPNIAIRILLVDTHELLRFINTIHRTYRNGRNVNVTCPVCGEVTFDDNESSGSRQRLRL